MYYDTLKSGLPGFKNFQAEPTHKVNSA